jgi:PAS domain S-box-containing protein
MIVLLTMASFFIFAFVPLPRAYYPEIPFHRPEEFVPAVFFLLALIGYLRKGKWRRDAFEHWLVLSLIVGFVGQTVFMSFSGQLFDFGFDAAHALKKVSYLCVLTGLLVSMYAMFRRAEESGERTQAIVESVFDGIVTIDADGTVTAFNKAGERTFGYTADEVIGRNVRMLMPEPDHGQHDQYLRNFLETGEAKIIGIGREVVGRRKDGRQFPMDLAVTEMAVGGRRMFVGVCRDVTERKRAEERIVAANRELDAFAYSVSHDLRAPLRGLDGFSLALVEDYGDSLDDQARDYLRRIRAASQRMGQLIDDLLRLSRSTRGEMKMEEVDLSSVAESIVSELCRREPGRNVAVEIAPRLVAHGDAKLLRILLENLIGNAWKFTSRKDAARIEFGAERESGRPIYFVRDDGAGFDMTYGDKLFSAFQRLHGANEFEGTGIGLATCTRIVHRHGGEISAEGAVGKGATFSFTLAT